MTNCDSCTGHQATVTDDESDAKAVGRDWVEWGLANEPPLRSHEFYWLLGRAVAVVEAAWRWAMEKRQTSETPGEVETIERLKDYYGQRNLSKVQLPMMKHVERNGKHDISCWCGPALDEVE